MALGKFYQTAFSDRSAKHLCVWEKLKCVIERWAHRQRRREVVGERGGEVRKRTRRAAGSGRLCVRQEGASGWSWKLEEWRVRERERERESSDVAWEEIAVKSYEWGHRRRWRRARATRAEQFHFPSEQTYLRARHNTRGKRLAGWRQVQQRRARAAHSVASSHSIPASSTSAPNWPIHRHRHR